MSTVNTVLGPVDTSELGFTLSHEHLATNAAGILKTFPELVDRSGIIEQANATLKEAYREGLRTIIDVSTIDLGRDVEMMREVSKATGVHIIAATGNHLAVPRPFLDLAPEVIADLYVREIRNCHFEERSRRVGKESTEQYFVRPCTSLKVTCGQNRSLPSMEALLLTLSGRLVWY